MTSDQVRLERTIAAVRDALPTGEREEFTTIIDSTNVAKLPHTFEHWYRRALINSVSGLRERIASGLGSGVGGGIDFDEAFPRARKRWDARKHAA